METPLTIGIVGGMSPESTLAYYKHIVRAHVAARGDHGYPRIVIASVSFQQYVEWQHAGAWDDIARGLDGELAALAAAGADFAVIAANTMHKVVPQLASKLPLLHVLDAVAEEAKRRGARRLGLTGTGFTMNDGFYAAGLETRGFHALLPDAAERDAIHRMIYDDLIAGRAAPTPCSSPAPSSSSSRRPPTRSRGSTPPRSTRSPPGAARSRKVRSERVGPDAVAGRREVNAVEGVARVELAARVGQHGVEVEPVAAGRGPEERVGPLDRGGRAPGGELVADRQQRLDDDPRLRQAPAQLGDERGVARHELVGRDAAAEVVHADEEKEDLGLERDDVVEPRRDVGDGVAGDAAVRHRTAEELPPLAALGEAVAEHDHVALGVGHAVEHRGAGALVGGAERFRREEVAAGEERDRRDVQRHRQRGDPAKRPRAHPRRCYAAAGLAVEAARRLKPRSCPRSTRSTLSFGSATATPRSASARRRRRRSSGRRARSATRRRRRSGSPSSRSRPATVPRRAVTPRRRCAARRDRRCVSSTRGPWSPPASPPPRASPSPRCSRPAASTGASAPRRSSGAPRWRCARAKSAAPPPTSPPPPTRSSVRPRSATRTPGSSTRSPRAR